MIRESIYRLKVVFSIFEDFCIEWKRGLWTLSIIFLFCLFWFGGIFFEVWVLILWSCLGIGERVIQDIYDLVMEEIK